MNDAFIKEMGFEPSGLNFHERMQRLMAFRNEGKLYRGKCDFSGDEIISAYKADSPFKVYKNEVWWGDEWDGLDFGRNFDFGRGFFEQFKDLMIDVPREGTSVFNSVNCDYSSHTRESKNCYLNTLAVRSENVYYSYWAVNDKNVLDCIMVNNSEICYECIDGEKCYKCFVCHNVRDCSDCYFSFQMSGCRNCLFCTNLVNREYCVENKKVSEEEFEKARKDAMENFEESREKFLKLRGEAIHRTVDSLNCENVTGVHNFNSRNCENVFAVENSEDVTDSISAADGKNIHSCYSAGWPACEKVYFCDVTRGCTDIAFCSYSWFSSGLRYCDSMNSCHDCFGCIGLKHKRYCILNKQYTKEEYEELMIKIIEHMKRAEEWGDFFPFGLSPFAYNETPAMDHYPLSKDEAPSWYEASGEKRFKIIGAEKEFYDKFGLPYPTKHPDDRFAERFALRNWYKMFDRKCDKCGAEMKSGYSEDRPEKVYCEKCYLKEVY